MHRQRFALSFIYVAAQKGFILDKGEEDPSHGAINLRFSFSCSLSSVAAHILFIAVVTDRRR